MACYKLGSGTAVSRFPCSRQLVLDRSDRVFIIWSKRIRTFACRYQKPMPYHLAILHTALFWTVERGEGEGRSREVNLRAVQERGDIASKQQDYLLLTDYNKLATLIETNGKLSSVLFACNAIPIKVGERFCNLRLVTLFD